MLKKYISNIEFERAEKEVPNKKERAFSFGLTELGIDSTNVSCPISTLRNFSEKNLKNNLEYFSIPGPLETVRRTHKSVILQSSIKTEDQENNLIHVELPRSASKERLLLILPYWNSDHSGLKSIADMFERTGIPSARVILPYHGPRQPDYMDHAEGMFSPNLGLTIRSVRQAILDVRGVIDWAKRSGYKRIDLLGVSMGSIIGSMVSVIDSNINSSVLCLAGSHIANLAYEGVATKHVHGPVQKNISNEDLVKIWDLISPIAHLSVERGNPNLKQLCITAKYDLVIPEKRAIEYIEKSKEVGIPTKWKSLPCGHYTLGSPVFGSTAYILARKFLS